MIPESSQFIKDLLFGMAKPLLGCETGTIPPLETVNNYNLLKMFA
jgi:hypothetical protein